MFHNIRHLLETRSREFQDRVFLSHVEGGTEISYSELDSLVNQTANLLLSLGISKGDTVSLLLPNVPEFVLCYLACAKIGALAGPLNTHLKSAEIQYILE